MRKLIRRRYVAGMSFTSIVRFTLLSAFVVAGAAVAQQDAVMKTRQTSHVTHASVSMRHIGSRVSRAARTVGVAEASARTARAVTHRVVHTSVHFRH
jgi:hypothetical protein